MQKIFLFLLFNSTVILAQNQYPETQNPNNMSDGVYYQTGPGSNNGTLNWTYPYGTKLTVLGNASRNFELSTSGYPYGNLKIRQWDPFNNVWTSWRDILLTDQSGNVGIGTTTPQNKLDIKGGAVSVSDGGNGVPFKIWAGGSGNSNQLRIGTDFGHVGDAGLEIYQNYSGGSEQNPGKVIVNGNLGVGTASPDSKLTVKGKIHAEEVKIDLSVLAPDYVFKEGYNPMSLEDIRQFIKEHGHLPNIPSAKNMEENGVELGVMNMKLLEKIEELILYVMELKKINDYQLMQIEKNTSLKEEVALLQAQNTELAKRLKVLENR